MLLYSTLYLSGYGLTLEDLENFRQLGSITPGHPEYGSTPGVEATTGPLGQGLSMATGVALAERMLAARLNRDGNEIIGHHTFAIASDGDLQEGIASEASSLAGHLGLGRLIVFYDNNKIQLAGPTEQSFTEDVAARYAAYGWRVDDVGEDLSIERLERATREAMAVLDRPSLILVRSHIGFGSPHKQDTSGAHGSALGEDEVRLTKQAYGWDPDQAFPRSRRRPRALPRRPPSVGRRREREWQERLELYGRELPELAGAAARVRRAPPARRVGRALPPRWLTADDKPIATRKASEAAIQWAAAQFPKLVGGSADLAPSTNTDIADGARRRAWRLRRPQHPLRRSRARDGGDRQRPRAPRLPRPSARPS